MMSDSRPPVSSRTFSKAEHPRDEETRKAEIPDVVEPSPAVVDGEHTAGADGHVTSGTRSPAAQQLTQSE